MNSIQLGVAVILLSKNKKALLGLRLVKFGHGKLAFPGGTHEPEEYINEACMRELEEETGITFSNFTPQSTHIREKIRMDGDNAVMESHWIVHYCVYNWSGNDQEVIKSLEPEKNGDFNWYSLQELEEFHKQGKLFSDIGIIRKVMS